jgi:hypothetical protein
MSRRILLASLFLTVGTVAGGWAVAQTTDGPDHDYDLAKEKYGTNPACPKGDVFQIAQWEDAAAIAANQLASAPVENNLVGDIPALDVVWVTLADPSPLIAGVPEGGMFAVACMKISPDEMVLIDGDGVVIW